MSEDLSDYSHSNMPRGEIGNLTWKIVRAPAAGELKLVCYSHDMLWLDTHFYLGRTGPHRNVNCLACKFKAPIRDKGYLLCQDGKTGNNVIFEFTPPAYQALKDAHVKYESLRGAQLLVTRAGKKGNSRVVVEVKGSIKLPADACPAMSVWPMLAKIWCLGQRPDQGLPPDDDIEIGEEPSFG